MLLCDIFLNFLNYCIQRLKKLQMIFFLKSAAQYIGKDIGKVTSKSASPPALTEWLP